MVGIVVTISPSFSLYRMVVFPAASRPTIRIRISFLPNRPLNRLANTFPMVTKLWKQMERKKQVRKVPKSQSERFGVQVEKMVALAGHNTMSFPRSVAAVNQLSVSDQWGKNVKPTHWEQKTCLLKVIVKRYALWLKLFYRPKIIQHYYIIHIIWHI